MADFLADWWCLNDWWGGWSGRVHRHPRADRLSPSTVYRLNIKVVHLNLVTSVLLSFSVLFFLALVSFFSFVLCLASHIYSVCVSLLPLFLSPFPSPSSLSLVLSLYLTLFSSHFLKFKFKHFFCSCLRFCSTFLIFWHDSRHLAAHGRPVSPHYNIPSITVQTPWQHFSNFSSLIWCVVLALKLMPITLRFFNGCLVWGGL